jgi:peptide/nickel transport system ATP-binding protein/oligopeptide transport system ATP-binding protein
MLIASNPEPDPQTERARATIPITGEIASPINVGAGCRFASRCPQVMDQCTHSTPALRATAQAGPARQVACHLYEPQPQ